MYQQKFFTVFNFLSVFLFLLCSCRSSATLPLQSQKQALTSTSKTREGLTTQLDNSKGLRYPNHDAVHFLLKFQGTGKEQVHVQRIELRLQNKDVVLKAFPLSMVRKIFGDHRLKDQGQLEGHIPVPRVYGHDVEMRIVSAKLVATKQSSGKTKIQRSTLTQSFALSHMAMKQYKKAPLTMQMPTASQQQQNTQKQSAYFEALNRHQQGAWKTLSAAQRKQEAAKLKRQMLP